MSILADPADTAERRQVMPVEFSKVQIARRLLDEAIRGWVRGDDPLTVHLGTLSAFTVTKDVRNGRGLGQASIEPYIREEGAKAFWNAFFRLNSAIKHANRDPDAMVDLTSVDARTEIVIILTIDNLSVLEPDAPPGFWSTYFWAHFAAAHPDAIDRERSQGFLEAAGAMWEQLDHDEIRRYAALPCTECAEALAFVAALQQAADVARG